MVLMALLALAPFLHGHLGASHVSGFHMDGLDVAHATAAQDTFGSVSAHAWGEEESPAMGVSVSLPQPGGDAPLVAGLAVLLFWALLARHAQSTGLRLRPVAPGSAPSAYEPGWPPPALAPPR
jgi:hypothetical protein